MLTVGKVIEKTFDLKDFKVDATNKRLLKATGSSLQDYDYAHISSIEYQSERSWWIVLLAIVVIAGGILMRIGSYEVEWFYLSGVEFILVILFALYKREWVKVWVI